MLYRTYYPALSYYILFLYCIFLLNHFNLLLSSLFFLLIVLPIYCPQIFVMYLYSYLLVLIVLIILFTTVHIDFLVLYLHSSWEPFSSCQHAECSSPCAQKAQKVRLHSWYRHFYHRWYCSSIFYCSLLSSKLLRLLSFYHYSLVIQLLPSFSHWHTPPHHRRILCHVDHPLQPSRHSGELCRWCHRWYVLSELYCTELSALFY